MTRYAYNQQVVPPAPFVHVTLEPPAGPARGVLATEVAAQLDTAADISVVPQHLVDALQLVQVDEVFVEGFGGHVLAAPVFVVALAVRSLAPVVIRVLASR